MSHENFSSLAHDFLSGLSASHDRDEELSKILTNEIRQKQFAAEMVLQTLGMIFSLGNDAFGPVPKATRFIRRFASVIACLPPELIFETIFDFKEGLAQNHRFRDERFFGKNELRSVIRFCVEKDFANHPYFVNGYDKIAIAAFNCSASNVSQFENMKMELSDIHPNHLLQEKLTPLKSMLSKKDMEEALSQDALINIKNKPSSHKSKI